VVQNTTYHYRHIHRAAKRPFPKFTHIIPILRAKLLQKIEIRKSGRAFSTKKYLKACIYAKFVVPLQRKKTNKPFKYYPYEESIVYDVGSLQYDAGRL
jgi:hypothetical protein